MKYFLVFMLMYSFAVFGNQDTITCNGCTSFDMRRAAEQRFYQFSSLTQVNVINLSNEEVRTYNGHFVPHRDPTQGLELRISMVQPDNALFSAVQDTVTFLNNNAIEVHNSASYRNALDAARERNPQRFHDYVKSQNYWSYYFSSAFSTLGQFLDIPLLNADKVLADM